jgi:DNA-binding MarR family transcriptional regulator
MNDKHATASTPSLLLGLLHAAHAIEARIEGSLGEIGLSMTKLSVLTALAKASEALTLGDLATAVACVRSNITQVVDRLEADGLVHRVADHSDRRVVRAALTGAGTERQRDGAARLLTVQQEFEAAIGPADQAALTRLVSATG